MIYKDLPSYQVLLLLGCRDETGPIQAKKGIVKIVMPDGGAYYHFDPNYKYDNVYVSRALRQANGTSRTVLFMKKKEENDYNLAFLAFILNWYGARKISGENIFELIDKYKLKIFSSVF